VGGVVLFVGEKVTQPESEGVLDTVTSGEIPGSGVLEMEGHTVPVVPDVSEAVGSEGTPDTGDNGVDAADVCSNEPSASTSDDELAVTAAELQQPLTADADNVEHTESSPLQNLDEQNKDGTQLSVASELDVETEGNKADELSDAVPSDNVVEGHGSQDKDGLRISTQSGRSDSDAVAGVEVDLKETRPHIRDDLPEDQNPADSANPPRKIDWDALDKRKQKSSDGESAEFSVVFNKVMKNRSLADNKDLPVVTAERTYSSGSESPASSRTKFAARPLPSKTSKVSGKTEREVEQQKPVLLSSSKADIADNKQTESVELSERAEASRSFGMSSPDTKPSSPGKDSSVVSKSVLYDDTRPVSPGSKTRSLDDSMESSFPGKTSSVAVEVNPRGEGMRSSSRGKESATKTEPCSENGKPSSGKETSAATSTESDGENTRPLSSPGKELSEVTKTEEHDISVEPQVEETLTEVGSTPGTDPQSNEESINPVRDKKTERIYISAGGSGLTVSSPESGSCTPNDGGSVNASVDAKVITESSGEEKPSETKDEAVSPVTDRQTLPVETTCPSDPPITGDSAEDRHSAVNKSAGSDVSKSAEVPESRSGQDQNSTDVNAATNTLADSYVARTVPPQQRRVVQRRSAAKVQPSEPKNEEPAWVIAAKRKSNQWNEGRAEEMERKPQKAVGSVDDEVSYHYLTPSLRHQL